MTLSTRGRVHSAPSGVTTSYRPPRLRNVSGMCTVIDSPSAETVVRAVVAGWVEDFTTARPHSAIGCMTPAGHAATLDPQPAPALRHLETSAPMPVAIVALRRNSQPGFQ